MAGSKLSKSSIFLSFGPIVLMVILTILYDLIKSDPIFSLISLLAQHIVAFCSNVFRIVVTILSYSMPSWLIIALIILVVLSFRLVRKYSSIGTTPHYISYKQDILKSWIWSWDWKYNSYENAWTIFNLKAHCPRCDTPMMNSIYMSDYFVCPRCNHSPHEHNVEYPSRIELVILDNVKRDLYTVSDSQKLIELKKED